MRTTRWARSVTRWVSFGSAMLVATLTLKAADLPVGWFAAGSHPAEYQMGVDTTVRHNGKASGSIRANTSKSHGFGTLMQTAVPGDYAGKRLRLSGYVRSEKVQSGWAGLWLRIDGPMQAVLGFDNMQSRPIKGTQDWTRCEIVLDVPTTAVALAYGLLLDGDGVVWLDDLKFEVVPSTVPVTGVPSLGLGRSPQNLDFEK
jgi:hypothetical protein